MLANSANSSNDSSSTTEASRALHALNQALPYAHSIAERSQLELSINLHQHHHQSLLHHHKQLHTLQTTLTRAQSALKQSQQGQLNDQQRLRRLQSDSVFSLMAPLRKKERESAQNALGFSDMMVERAQRDVMRVEAEIGTMREKFEESSRRMRDECWMAEQACQGVLRRAGMVAETQQQPAAVTPLTPPLIPPVPPPPPPPPPTPPDLPQSNQITTHRYTAAKQRPPPPPPQSQRPFSISADTSFEIQASLHHFQSTLPPELLHPLATPPPPSTSTGSAGSATTINFSTSLWHALYMTLRYIYPHAEVTLDQGNALFGADAYLNLQTTIRLPVLIANTFSSSHHSSSATAAAENSDNEHYRPRCSVSGNQRALTESFGLKSSFCDLRKVESTIKKLVLLISTERQARNSGLLVSKEGVVVVRRTARQSVCVSHLCGIVDGWIHPVAFIAWYMAVIIESPVVEYEPPLFL